MRNVITVLTVSLLIGGLLGLYGGSTSASNLVVEEDFLTGGGFIITTAGGTHPADRGNFGVGGGVRNGDWWGHLNYIDHSSGLHVHGTSVTAYFRSPDDPADSADLQTGQPHGYRHICGTARTDNPDFPEVFYHVLVADNSEPGVNDIFIIRVTEQTGPGVFTEVYFARDDQNNTLGGTGPGGGNINLHRHNPSNIAPGTAPVCNA